MLIDKASCVVILIIGLFITSLLGVFESIFYFPISIRKYIIEIFSILLLISILYIFFKYYLNKNSIFNNYDDLLVANNFLGNQTSFGDNLINALQLEKSISKLNNGKDLAYHAIKLVINDLNKIPIELLYKPISSKIKKIFFFTLLLLLILFTTKSTSLLSAYSRLLQPNTNFPIPKPFVLKSISKNQQILGGDSVLISIAGYGALPDSIQLFWKNSTNSGQISIPKSNEIYNYTFYLFIHDVWFCNKFF